MKNDALKKHHFWILFGVAAVFIPLAFLLMWLMVSGEVAAKGEAYKKQLDDLKVDAKSTGEVKALEQRKDALTEQKGKLHLSNYDRQEQAKVFEWPTGNDPNLIAHNLKKYKFGFPVRNIETEFEKQVLEKAFEREYKRFAEELRPTQFTSGSWRSTLRYVSDWGRVRVDPAEFWLALEDYWVQKAVLRTLTQVNEDAALFADVTPKEADAPLKRQFRNHVWELHLEVTQQGSRQMMSGTLKNRTDRLQVLGMDKAMRVHVWLDDPKAAEKDFEFLIQGEMVPGKKEVKCEPRELKGVPAVTKIAKVKQVFDEATVPVRLINTIDLGRLDHKNRAAVLMQPKHIEDAAATDPVAVAPAASGVGPGEEGGVGGRPAAIDLGGGMGGMLGGAATGRAKTGTPKAVLMGNKARYLTRTEDVRRMPVALSVIVDRDFVNDLLVAYANSPLRFQITQTQWQRYRGAGYATGGESAGPGMGGPSAGAPGGAGSPDGGEGGPGGREGMRGGGPDGMRGGPGGMFGGLGGFGGIPGGTLTTTGNTPPPESTAGLVELAVYGVVSLYEKTAPKPVDPAAPAPEQPMTPADPAPPKDPAATPPAGEQPKAPTPAEPPGDGKPAAQPKEPAGKEPTGEAPTPPNK